MMSVCYPGTVPLYHSTLFRVNREEPRPQAGASWLSPVNVKAGGRSVVAVVRSRRRLRRGPLCYVHVGGWGGIHTALLRDQCTSPGIALCQLSGIMVELAGRLNPSAVGVAGVGRDRRGRPGRTDGAAPICLCSPCCNRRSRGCGRISCYWIVVSWVEESGRNDRNLDWPCRCPGCSIA